MEAAEAKIIAADAAMEVAMASGLNSPIREAAEIMRTAEAAMDAAEAAMMAAMKSG